MTITDVIAIIAGWSLSGMLCYAIICMTDGLKLWFDELEHWNRAGIVVLLGPIVFVTLFIAASGSSDDHDMPGPTAYA